jgi:hypothetical protein
VPIQDLIDRAASTVRDRWVIVITLLVNDTRLDDRGFHIVKMFIEFFGEGAPNDVDKRECCTLLKSGLLQVDGRLNVVNGDYLECIMDEKLTVKRDASYVATLAFPGTKNGINSEGSGEKVVLSVMAIFLAVIAQSLF